MIIKLSRILSKKKKKPSRSTSSFIALIITRFKQQLKYWNPILKIERNKEKTHTNHSNENIVKVICTCDLEHERSTIHKLKNPFTQKLNKWVSKWNFSEAWNGFMAREVSWVGARVKLGKRVKWVYGRKSTCWHWTGVVFLVDFSPELFSGIGPM